VSESHGYQDAPNEAKVVEQRAEEIDARRSDFQRCFDTPAGEKVLAYLYESCSFHNTTFVSGSPDHTAYNEGRRSVMLEIMGYLVMDDESLFQLARSYARPEETR
jgi:hypothetical protein